MEDKFQVGVITSTHGVRGEVKVFPTTDDVKRFKRLKEAILDTGKEQIYYKDIVANPAKAAAKINNLILLDIIEALP